MITLQTGLPGHGKTLHTLWVINSYVAAENKRLKEEADKTGAVPLVRQVFYSGIKDLSLPWTEFDPTTWMDLPAGAIIVMDECQDVFPPLPTGAKKPAHYQMLAKHRHSGFDIFLITQDPALIDNFVRKLCERHFHSVRIFGLQRNTIYEWSFVQQAPRSASAQKAAVKNSWKFPKEVFKYYKSAEVHTVVRRVPKKLIFAVLFILCVPVLVYLALNSYSNRFKKPETSVAPGGSSTLSSASTGQPNGSTFDPELDARQYVHSQTPRVQGLQLSAPKYDNLTKPTSVPVPAMCIKRGDRCQCYTQQATKLDMPMNVCLDIAHNGYFREFQADQGAQAPVSAGAPAGDRPSYREAGSSSNVTYIPYIPDPKPYWAK